MGQSKRVAEDHYLHATEEQFRQAAEKQGGIAELSKFGYKENR